MRWDMSVNLFPKGGIIRNSPNDASPPYSATSLNLFDRKQPRQLCRWVDFAASVGGGAEGANGLAADTGDACIDVLETAWAQAPSSCLASTSVGDTGVVRDNSRRPTSSFEPTDNDLSADWRHCESCRACVKLFSFGEVATKAGQAGNSSRLH